MLTSLWLQTSSWYAFCFFDFHFILIPTLQSSLRHPNVSTTTLLSLIFIHSLYRHRRARKDSVLPLSMPIKGKNGCDIREIHIPKGTSVMITILGANRNPEIWGDDSDEWKPERWLAPLPDTVMQAHFPSIYSNMSVIIRTSCQVLLILLPSG